MLITKPCDWPLFSSLCMLFLAPELVRNQLCHVDRVAVFRQYRLPDSACVMSKITRSLYMYEYFSQWKQPLEWLHRRQRQKIVLGMFRIVSSSLVHINVVAVAIRLVSCDTTLRAIRVLVLRTFDCRLFGYNRRYFSGNNTIQHFKILITFIFRMFLESCRKVVAIRFTNAVSPVCFEKCSTHNHACCNF